VTWVAEKGAGQSVVLDGVPGPSYDKIEYYLDTFAYSPDRLVFSPNGKRLAYSARKGNKVVVVVDGHEGPEFDLIFAITFSPTGSRGNSE
jgi:WD40-like Beta Propeller Repeat